MRKVNEKMEKALKNNLITGYNYIREMWSLNVMSTT